MSLLDNRELLLDSMRRTDGMYSKGYVQLLVLCSMSNMQKGHDEEAFADAREAEMIADKAFKEDDLRIPPLAMMFGLSHKRGDITEARKYAHLLYDFSLNTNDSLNNAVHAYLTQIVDTVSLRPLNQLFLSVTPSSLPADLRAPFDSLRQAIHRQDHDARHVEPWLSTIREKSGTAILRHLCAEYEWFLREMCEYMPTDSLLPRFVEVAEAYHRQGEDDKTRSILQDRCLPLIGSIYLNEPYSSMMERLLRLAQAMNDSDLYLTLLKTKVARRSYQEPYEHTLLAIEEACRLQAASGQPWKSSDEPFLAKAAYVLHSLTIDYAKTHDQEKTEWTDLQTTLLSAYFSVSEGRDNQDYGFRMNEFLNRTRNIHYKEKDESKARHLLQRYSEDMLRVWGDDHPYYYRALSRLSDCTDASAPDFSSTIEQALQTAQRAYRKGSKSYDEALEQYQRQATRHIEATLMNRKDTLGARACSQRLLAHMAHIRGTSTPQYFQSLQLHAKTYAYGDPQYRALCDSMLATAERIYEKGSDNYYRAIEQGYYHPMPLHLSSMLSHDSLQVQRQARVYLGNIRRIWDDSDPHYYKALTQQLWYYPFEHPEYGELCGRILEAAGRLHEKGSTDYLKAVEQDYADHMDTHIRFLTYRGDTLHARQQAELLVENMETIYGETDPHYYQALQALDNCYDYYDPSSRLLREHLLSVARTLYGEDSEEAQTIVSHLSELGRYNHDMDYAIEQAHITQDLLDIADLYYDYGDYRKGNELVKEKLRRLFDQSPSLFGEAEADTLYSIYLKLAISYQATGNQDSLLHVMRPYLTRTQLTDSLALLYAVGVTQRLKPAHLPLLDTLYDTLEEARPAITHLTAYPARYANKARILAKEHPEAARQQIAHIAEWWEHHGGIDTYRRYFLTQQRASLSVTLEEWEPLFEEMKTALRQIPHHEELYDYQSNLIVEARLALYHRDYERARQCIDRYGSYRVGDRQRSIRPWPDLFSPYTVKDDTIAVKVDYLFSDVEVPLLLHEQAYDEARRIVTQQTAEYTSATLWQLLNDYSPMAGTESEMTQANLDMTGMLALHTRQGGDAAMAYDAALLGKQLYLNSQKELEEFIRLHGDPRTQEKMAALHQAREQLDHAADTEAADSLSLRVAQLERQVISDSQRSGDFTQGLTCHWQDVRDRLAADEAAVEFISVGFIPDTLYAALLITPHCDYPRAIALPEKRALADSLQSPRATYHALWEPILNEVGQARTLYFSPSGLLHQSPIEYATDDEGRLLSEKLRLYRLSSTRQLTKRPKRKGGRLSALLYGGINYNKEPIDHRSVASLSRGASTESDTEDLRGALKTFTYLPGTLEEVQEIDTILRSQEVNTQLLTDDKATEQSFKRLSGQSPDIIHVATHGFYIGAYQRKKQPFNIFVNSGNTSAEDLALSRSGLLFSGASSIFRQSKTRKGVEDGVLTARELSRLDLSNTHLAVLSACETATGQVSGDGVFGLQRGFKKAGVGTLLMTLWRVDDTATQLLLTRFYHHLFVEGLSVYDALVRAQQHLRTTQGGRYADRRYWAAFILMDGEDTTLTVGR